MQTVRMPAELGQTTTLRIVDAVGESESGRRVRIELRITTPGGSVIVVPIAGATEIRLTAGTDVAACKLDLDVTEADQVPPGELH